MLVFDEIDFKGTLTITGDPLNSQTKQSGPQWAIYADVPSAKKLPEVAYPYGLNRGQVALTNEAFSGQQLQVHFQQADTVTVVIEDLREYFPGGHVPPTFSAKLVRELD